MAAARSLDVRAVDRSRVRLTDTGDGLVELAVAQAPDRSVAVRLPADVADAVAQWLTPGMAS